MSHTGREVLLVEDDVVDAMTIQRAFSALDLEYPLTQVRDGKAALDYLQAEARRPAFILLDLNMPRMNGLEFLQVRSEDEFLRQIPVVVLTTSGEEKERLDSSDLRVDGYMVKPIEYGKFLEIVRLIDSGAGPVDPH